MIDINNIKIGTKVYYKNGREFEVYKITLESCCYPVIDVMSIFGETILKESVVLSPDHCKDWSIEPPKAKRKYWLWSIENYDGIWIKNYLYLDDCGMDTKGNRQYSRWEKLEKIKHENEFVEV